MRFVALCIFALQEEMLLHDGGLERVMLLQLHEGGQERAMVMLYDRVVALLKLALNQDGCASLQRL